MSRAAILRRVIKSVEAAIERDRDHRVRITRDYCAGEFDELVFGRPVPDWRCDDFEIRCRALWIFATGGREPICDGASLCPDRVGALDLAWGYIPHDLLYAHLAEMASDPAWIEAGWTESEIRRLADMVLARGVEHAGEVVGGAWKGVGGLVARIMHGAVRVFGGLYHRLALLLALAALCAALCGCSGCAIPGGFTPSDDPPPYTVEARRWAGCRGPSPIRTRAATAIGENRASELMEVCMQPFFQNDAVTIYNSDCFEIMPDFAGRNFDMVLTDPPYGVTQLEWDNAIDYGAFFAGLRDVTRRNTATLVFSQMPILCDVINANRREFRYEIIWEKTQKLGFLNAKKMPLKAHENILVFYCALPTYHPIKTSATQAPELRASQNGKKQLRFLGRARGNSERNRQGNLYHSVLAANCPDTYQYVEDGSRYPTDVIVFSNWNGMIFGKRNYEQHPTAKPVPLLEYLIKTYTNPWDVVFDPFGGGGSTALAAMRSGRRCVLVEREKKYCELAAERLLAETPILPNFASILDAGAEGVKEVR